VKRGDRGKEEKYIKESRCEKIFESLRTPTGQGGKKR